jgi:hypothetical protein
MNFQAHKPSELYGLPAWVASLAPAADYLSILLPASSAKLETNLAGGSVTVKGVTTCLRINNPNVSGKTIDQS